MILWNTTETLFKEVQRILFSIKPQTRQYLNQQAAIRAIFVRESKHCAREPFLSNGNGFFNTTQSSQCFGQVIPIINPLRLITHTPLEKREIAGMLVGLIAVIAQMINLYGRPHYF